MKLSTSMELRNCWKSSAGLSAKAHVWTIRCCCAAHTHIYSILASCSCLWDSRHQKLVTKHSRCCICTAHKTIWFLFFLLSYQVKTTQGDGKGNESKQGRGMSKGVRWAMVQKGEKREEVGVKDINEIWLTGLFNLLPSFVRENMRKTEMKRQRRRKANW